MRYFFDCEFIEDGTTIDLLSIGVVAEDGREFYQCNRDAKLNRASEWVIWNVYPHLGLHHGVDGWHWNEPDQRHPDMRIYESAVVVPRSEIRDRLRRFVDRDDPKPAFWAYYADYDWVALCQLFGRMIELPKSWPRYCMDLKQFCISQGNPVLKEQTSNEHHALADARWVKEAWEFLAGQR